MTVHRDSITDEDLIKIFSYREHKQNLQSRIIFVINRTLIFLASVCLVYFIINFNAFKEKFGFWYKTDLKSEETVDQSGKVITGTSVEEPAKQAFLPEMNDNSLKIISLSIDAPISWRVENEATAVAKALENGIIHIKGTALPGERGNIYITGHSSNYVWAKGNYNNIFALLNQLVPGELIYVKFRGQVYTYQVNDQKVVSANDLSIMAGSDESRLTLVTCWPVGTSFKRLAVIAKQIYPDAKKNPATEETHNIKKLPGAL